MGSLRIGLAVVIGLCVGRLVGPRMSSPFKAGLIGALLAGALVAAVGIAATLLG